MFLPNSHHSTYMIIQVFSKCSVFIYHEPLKWSYVLVILILIHASSRMVLKWCSPILRTFTNCFLVSITGGILICWVPNFLFILQTSQLVVPLCWQCCCQWQVGMISYLCMFFINLQTPAFVLLGWSTEVNLKSFSNCWHWNQRVYSKLIYDVFLKFFHFKMNVSLVLLGFPALGKASSGQLHTSYMQCLLHPT